MVVSTREKGDTLKRHGNLYSKIYSLDNLRLAHENARKKKTHYTEVQNIDSNLDFYLGLIQEMLMDENYVTSEYEKFIKIDNGKERTIYKLPYFPDRIVQWAIIQVLEPIFLNKLMHCTHSAIPKRGGRTAFNQLNKYIDGDSSLYCLKLDVSKFYPNIDRVLLKDMYSKFFKDKQLLKLLYEIIDSCEDGIPIGNYLSQYSGNLYLSQLDRYLKQDLRVKKYVRYMDDMVILSESKEYLHSVLWKICSKLSEMKLRIKGNYRISPVKDGIDFVGYVNYGTHVKLRKSIKVKMVRRCREVCESISEDGFISERDISRTMSYKGWVSVGDCRNLYYKYITPIENYIDYQRRWV